MPYGFSSVSDCNGLVDALSICAFVVTVRGMSQDTGKIRTEGRVLNAGRRAATAEGRITDGNGKLIAHATTTCMVFELPKNT